MMSTHTNKKAVSRGSPCSRCCSLFFKNSADYLNELQLGKIQDTSPDCPGCSLFFDHVIENTDPKLLRYLLQKHAEQAQHRVSTGWSVLDDERFTTDPTFDTVLSAGKKVQRVEWTLDTLDYRMDCLGDNDQTLEIEDVKGALVFRRLEAHEKHIPSLWSSEPSAGFPGSDALLSWMEACNEHHGVCRHPEEESHTLPTRLIDVRPMNDSNEPRLIASAQSCTPGTRYIALSHCWGNPALSLKTTRDTIDEHMRALPMSSLPKTFYDAVVVARTIGVRFLWIDSLCIIQGDKDDWEREAATMTMVYQNAYLTLAAATSPDSSGGLFYEREKSRIVEFLPTETESSPSARFLVRQTPKIEDYLQATPLFRRAWTFQEVLLSRRIVYFTPSQLIWQCWTGFQPEDGSIFRNRHQRDGSWFAWTTMLPIPFEDSDADQLDDLWVSWCHDYSERKISYASDRMAALAGLTSFVEQKKKDNSLLGLWETSIAKDLMWQDPLERHHILQDKTSRIEMFPSWSWLSVPYNVYPASRNSSGYYFEDVIRLIEANIQWSGEPYTSNLLKAELTIETKVIEGVVGDKETDRDFRIIRLKCVVGETSQWREYLYYEKPHHDIFVSGETVWFAVAGRRNGTEFLVLALVDAQRNTYVRLSAGRPAMVTEQENILEETIKAAELQTLILQ